MQQTPPGSFPDLPYDEERDIADYKSYAEKLLPFVTDTIEWVAPRGRRLGCFGRVWVGLDGGGVRAGRAGVSANPALYNPKPNQKPKPAIHKRSI